MASIDFNFKAIGIVHGGGLYPQQSPRQSIYAKNEGYIELFPHCNYEQALEDLDGFEKLWVIFVFDRNNNWKPKVQPPFGIDRKVGLFASRAPYRPNPIGISSVDIARIDGLRIYIRNFDMLEGTPVLDIKPYIPDVDAFPTAKAGWRDSAPLPMEISFSEEAKNKCGAIMALGGPDLMDVARIQLTLQSGSPERQRIIGETGSEQTLAYRTWRIIFKKEKDAIYVLDVHSGYTKEELEDSKDKYCDKEIHRKLNILTNCDKII